MTPTIVDALGLSFCSPYQLSTALKRLNVSHSIVSNKYWLEKTKMTIDLGKPQPVWVTIVDGIKSVKRYKLVKRPNQLLIIIDSEAILKYSNCRLIPQSDILEDSIKDALLGSNVDPAYPIKVEVKEPTMHDFVNQATKPSFLNHIQTAVYKISNYPVRKEIQKQIIRSLYGVSSMRNVLSMLSTSLKYETLHSLMKDEKATKLREAVIEFKGKLAKNPNENPDDLAKGYGFESFEILYVVRSYEKMVRDEALAKKGLLPKRGRKPKSPV
jgi:hypothetical protein